MCEILSEIQEITSQIDSYKTSIHLAKNQLYDIIKEIGADSDNLEDYSEELTHLYWFADIKPSILKNLLGITSPKLLSLLLPVSLASLCAICGEAIRVKSKNSIDYHVKDGKPICWDCWCKEKQIQENFLQHDFEPEMLKEAQKRSRLLELQSMPYNQYLKTPEWTERRNRHLKYAKYKCQICNQGNTVLNVHHRTYENRGNELINDLIVLCSDCHKTFHHKIKEGD